MNERILYWDLIGGAAGDMLLASLVDLGASIDGIRKAIDSLGLTDVELRLSEVHPESLRALQVDVLVRGELADAGDSNSLKHVMSANDPKMPPLNHGFQDRGLPPGVGEDQLSLGHGDHHHHGHGDDHHHGHGDHHHHGHGDDHHHGHSDHHHHGHGGIHNPSHGDHHHHVHGDIHDASHGIGTHHHHHGHRPWVVIRDLIDKAQLRPRAKAWAQEAFRRLAQAESFAHGVPMEQVEFHEVGSDDAIADIVGTAVALDELGIQTIIASPFPMGRGLSRGAHGALPIPGPATLHILKGVPIAETPLTAETVTPTGAALVCAVASDFGPIPSMRLQSVGVGAGHRRWPDRPNIVRAILGSSIEKAPLRSALNPDSQQLSMTLAQTQSPSTESAQVFQLETNIDDMNPEHLRLLFSELFAAGALDVWSTSSMFKKGRLGWVLGVLVGQDVKDEVLLVLFRHSSTLGVRCWPTERQIVARAIETVDTPYGPIRIKRSPRPGTKDQVKPEHDDVLRAASKHHVPMRVVEETVFHRLWHEEKTNQ